MIGRVTGGSCKKGERYNLIEIVYYSLLIEKVYKKENNLGDSGKNIRNLILLDNL